MIEHRKPKVIYKFIKVIYKFCTVSRLAEICISAIFRIFQTSDVTGPRVAAHTAQKRIAVVFCMVFGGKFSFFVEFSLKFG